MTISEKIKTLRKEHSITQKRLSEMTGIATITIQQYEAGKYKPKIEQLQKIAKALDVSISELLENSDYDNIYVQTTNNGRKIPYALNAITNMDSSPLNKDIPETAEDFNKIFNAGLINYATLLEQNPEAGELLKTYYELTPEQRQQVISMLKAFTKKEDK